MTPDRELVAQAYPWAFEPLPHEILALAEHRQAELAVAIELAGWARGFAPTPP
jgi:hypothetical protein